MFDFGKCYNFVGIFAFSRFAVKFPLISVVTNNKSMVWLQLVSYKKNS